MYFGRAHSSIYKDILAKEWLDLQFAKLTSQFQQAIGTYAKSVSEYYREKQLEFTTPERIFFHLAETKNNSKYPFAFMASYSELEAGQIHHYPLAHALTKYRNEQKKILELISSIAKLEKESSLIKQLLHSGELFQTIYFTQTEAYKFLKELELYAKAGILVKIPNWWAKNKKNSSLQMKVQTASKFGQDSLLAFQPEIMYYGLKLSKKELKEFLKYSEGLRLCKGNWVEINHEKLKDLLAQSEELEAETSDGLTLMEALKLARKGQKFFDLESILKFFQQAIKKLREKDKTFDLPLSVKAELRPYQLAGYKWLLAMDKLNMGVILVDDMGLGKTVQIIAYLENLRYYQKADKVLIELPTSLLANWEEELKKFAPSTPFVTYHAKNREIGEYITLTSYGLLKREAKLLDQKWDVVILDEAQAIKNINTQQTRAVKALKGRMKIALTCTPIENNLMDLFSIFDFILPDLLGSATQFQNYASNLKETTDGYLKLRQVVSPFIMRRLKTDKSIIKDLPKKLERKEYIDLAPKQAALYRKVVSDFAKKIAKLKGMDRRGMILAILGSLKQIINHPSQYSGSEEYKATESGKFLRLAELVQEIYQARERVLIFTQYREIIPYLAEFLCKSLGDNNIEPLVLHGGTKAKDRQKLVDEFNGDKYYPFMLISLKAGGVGLNLTGANHVIHFDRWWNPQIERQATDRAYRIGQMKDVLVHYFICSQTVDIAIDELLENKKNLSDSVIAENKTLNLTELSNEEICKFFALRKE